MARAHRGRQPGRRPTPLVPHARRSAPSPHTSRTPATAAPAVAAAAATATAAAPPPPPPSAAAATTAAAAAAATAAALPAATAAAACACGAELYTLGHARPGRVSRQNCVWTTARTLR